MSEIEKLEKKANVGDVEAMFQLGVAYAFGRGAELNPEKALHWLNKAASQGHTIAAAALKDIGRAQETSKAGVECEDEDRIKRVQLWKDGPYWADRNIGAENPWDFGYYFWWGDTVGYEWKNGKWVASDGFKTGCSFKDSNTATFGKDYSALRRDGWTTADDVLVPNHDAAQKHWGGDWRMPTVGEFEDLISKCDWKWTEQNIVKGYIVRGKGIYASESIFLPCAGDGYGTSLRYASFYGYYGYYWTSVPYSDSIFSWSLSFSSGSHNADYISRSCGRSVRPLQGVTK